MGSLGLLVSIILAYKLAQKYLLSGAVILDLATWAIIGAFIMARVFHVVFMNALLCSKSGRYFKNLAGRSVFFGRFRRRVFGCLDFCEIKTF